MARKHHNCRITEMFEDRTKQPLLSMIVSSRLLTPREQFVFRMYDLARLNLAELARQFGVSREILAREHRAACRKLDREYEVSKKLSPREMWLRYMPGYKPWQKKER
jgi:Zn-dependent peptidase ImmA (M78 family)